MASNAGKKLIQIDVSSDTVCPWCFVGKKNLEKAMEQNKDKFDFEVSLLQNYCCPTSWSYSVKLACLFAD
jgi:predicted DsbA family dithiol-disulfide isomerase